MKRERNSFKTPLIVEVMPSGKRFKLHYDFTYFWKRGNAEIHVGAGFVTDFASIPRFARLLIPKLGRYNKAAVIHDYLYHRQTRIVEGVLFKSYVFNRKQSDDIFLDAMEDLGVVKWKRKLMYLSVRAFGWLAWKRSKW